MLKKPKSSNKKYEKEKNKETENKELTTLLSKFNKEDIINSVVETPYNKPQVSTVKKEKLVKDVINILTEKFSDLDELLLFLYLKYCFIQKKERVWNVMEIKDGKRFKQSHLSPEKISESLCKYCNKNYISCKVFSEKREGCILSVLFLGEEKPKKPSYFVSHLKLSLIFYNSVPTKYKSKVLQVLRKSYRGKHINELPNFCANITYIKKATIKDKFLSQHSKNKGVENPEVHLDNNIVIESENIKDKNVSDLKKHSTTKKTQENNRTYNLRNRVDNDNRKKNELQENNVAHYSDIKKKPINPPDNFVSSNTKKDKALKILQSNLVPIYEEENVSECLHRDVRNHKAKNRKKPNELKRDFVADNVKADHDGLQRSFISPKKKKYLNQLQNNIQDLNGREDSFEDFARNVVPSEAKKKKKHSYFVNDTVSCEAKKEKFSKGLQNNNFVTYGKNEKTKISNNLNTTYMINNDRTKETHDSVLNSTFVINNARDYEEKGSVESQTETEPQLSDMENIKHLKKTEKSVQNNLEKRNLTKTENLKYIMKTNFFGSRENTNSVCVVNFHGADVLKGLEKLVECGIVDSSLPKYISEEPKTGKTEFIVKL